MAKAEEESDSEAFAETIPEQDYETASEASSEFSSKQLGRKQLGRKRKLNIYCEEVEENWKKRYLESVKEQSTGKRERQAKDEER